jgi:hypothetical protein
MNSKKLSLFFLITSMLINSAPIMAAKPSVMEDVQQIDDTAPKKKSGLSNKVKAAIGAGCALTTLIVGYVFLYKFSQKKMRQYQRQPESQPTEFSIDQELSEQLEEEDNEEEQPAELPADETLIRLEQQAEQQRRQQRQFLATAQAEGQRRVEHAQAIGREQFARMRQEYQTDRQRRNQELLAQANARRVAEELNTQIAANRAVEQNAIHEFQERNAVRDAEHAVQVAAIEQRNADFANRAFAIDHNAPDALQQLAQLELEFPIHQ